MSAPTTRWSDVRLVAGREVGEKLHSRTFVLSTLFFLLIIAASIALPALLSAGIPPIAAFGTNKVQSVIGTGIAAATYWRKGFVSLPDLGVPHPQRTMGKWRARVVSAAPTKFRR